MAQLAQLSKVPRPKTRYPAALVSPSYSGREIPSQNTVGIAPQAKKYGFWMDSPIGVELPELKGISGGSNTEVKVKVGCYKHTGRKAPQAPHIFELFDVFEE